MKIIGYFGPEGSFTEEALINFRLQNQGFAPDPVSIVAYPTISRLLYACERSEVDWAFVPVENSTEGQVAATTDTLGRTENLLIIREFIHPIEQCLLTKKQIPLSEISRIFSHEQSLGQCREFLNAQLSHAEQIVCSNNAEAARKISQSNEKWAAIAPRRAAQVYKLHCQLAAIQDEKQNTTRFIMVGQQLAERSGKDKTSLLLKTADTPGSLFNALKVFADRQINLSRIESRPSKQKLGEYIFFVDLDGYVFSSAIQDALRVLKEDHVLTKLLGSYPKA
ncbi:MAG: prephenate dehydratase [Desulfitobacteriaceae bacterium]